MAIGETGLDYFRDFSPRDRQREAFERQLSIAEETGLPLADCAMDRVLLVHELENSESARAMLREIWRVLTPEGRLLAVDRRSGQILWEKDFANQTWQSPVVVDDTRRAQLEQVDPNTGEVVSVHEQTFTTVEGTSAACARGPCRFR